MPIKLDLKFDKILASLLLLLLSFQITIFELVRSERFNDDNKTRSTGTIQANSSFVSSTSSPSSHATNSSSFKVQLFTNHRMDPVNTSTTLSPNDNSTRLIHDRLASDSILRPQLALQIYTNPAPVAGAAATTNQDGGNIRNSNNVNFQAASRPTGTMLILPISQSHQDDQNYNNNNNHHHHYQQTPQNTQNSKQQQQQQRSRKFQQGSFENPRMIHTSAGEITTNRLNPWHYVTDQSVSTGPILDSFVSSVPSHNSGGGSGSSTDGSTSHDGEDSPSNSQNGVNGPMINAIITVPAASDHYHHHHHHPELDPLQTNNSANSVEQTFTRLLEGHQAAGNIEFSMNLNGDEIIINPIGNKHATVVNLSSNNTSKDIDSDQSDEIGSLLAARRYINRRNRADSQTGGISKALKKHVSSELVGDQQSASEIDGLIEGGSSDDSDTDDDFESNSTKDKQDGDDVSSSRLKFKAIEGEMDKDERLGSHRFWQSGSSSSSHPESSNDNDSINGVDGEQATDETHNESRHSNNNYSPRDSSSSYYDHNEDDKKASSNTGGNHHHHHNHHGKQAGIKITTSSNNNNKGNGRRHRVSEVAPSSRSSPQRKAAGSKRRATFRSDEDAKDTSTNTLDDRAYEKRGSERDSDHVSSVMIKGEDVRKFEQLLESLRSLSLNNLTATKLKRANSAKTMNKVSQDNRNGDDSYYSTSQQDKRSAGHQQQQRNQSPSNRMAHQSERTAINHSDCDRRKQQQQQLHKSASSSSGNSDSSSAFEPDSSPNIVDHDPITSNDGIDDLNDDSSQNIEQDEQGSDNHNKLSLPNLSLSETATASDSDQPLTDNSFYKPAQIDDQPKSMFVRKTILQSYYDSNGKQVSSNVDKSDDLESIHKSQHEAQHELHSGTGSTQGVANQLRQQVAPQRQTDQTARANMAAQHRQVNHLHQAPRPPPPLNNYIDYNQLDDREIFRGSESKKFNVHVVGPPREQLIRMRSLQQMIEKAAIEAGKLSANTSNNAASKLVGGSDTFEK